MKQKCQDIADQQALGEGQCQVLVLAEAKTLPHPFVEGLVAGDGFSDRAGGFGFLTHASRTGNRWLNLLSAYKDRIFHEAPERAGGEGWLYSEQQQKQSFKARQDGVIALGCNQELHLRFAARA